VTAILAWAAVAIAVRLGVAWACAASGVFADMVQYHERAVHLVATGTLFPDALRGPGYPAWLAAAYAIGGVSLWTARVANAVAGGVLTGLTGWLAVRAGAGRHAWTASAVVAVYPSLVLSAVYVMPDSFYATLVVLTLLLVRHRAVSFSAAAGVAAGGAMLTRSVGLALVAPALALGAWDRVTGVVERRAVAMRVSAFLLACVVVLVPWLTFTTRVAGGALLDATSGMNVLLGNHANATGRLSLGDDGPLRRQFVDGAASIADGNRRALAAGLAWARANPGAWVRLAGRKLGYLLGLEGREHAWAYSLGYFGPRVGWVVVLWGVLLIASFPLLVLGAAWGVVRASAPWERTHVAMAAFVGATCALHVASFGESRFHLPLVPVLAAVASLGPGPGGVSARASAVRIALVGAIVFVLSVAWAGQATELLAALDRLRAPDGWQSTLPY
jgi:4-amino-4-deoxy-L-arabinose transferase-like glycosyltransferase